MFPIFGDAATFPNSGIAHIFPPGVPFRCMAFGTVLGTTTAQDVLVYLLRHGETPVTKVQSNLGVSHDRFYGALDTLRALGYVSRDMRTGRPTYVYLGLTREGERIARILAPAAEALEATADALAAECERLERAGEPASIHRRIALLRLLVERESARNAWEDALGHASRLLALARDAGDRESEAEAHLVLGRIAQRRDAHAEATKTLQDALRLADAGGAPRVACEAEYLIGSSFLRQGRGAEALERFDSLASRAERSMDDLWRARAIEAKGRVYARQGRPADAIPLMEEAAAIFERLGAVEDLPRTYVNRGSASYDLDRPDALPWFEKAVGAARYVVDVRMEAYAMSSAAAPLIERGEIRKAERYLHRARGIFEDFGERSAIGGVELNLGNAYAAQGHWTDAEEDFGRALQAARDTGKRALEATAHLNHGQMLKRRGLADGARAHLEEARRIFRELGNAARAARCDEELRDLTGRRTRSRSRPDTRPTGRRSPGRSPRRRR